MASTTYAQLLDAAHVRLAELATALRAARKATADDHFSVTRLVAALLDLRFGIERAGSFPDDSTEQRAILAYLNETYGLTVAYTDPLLHSQLPPLPATGSAVEVALLAPNGYLLLLNNMALIGVGATLRPAAVSAPVPL